jgi:Family of unknown function (DUF5999)
MRTQKVRMCQHQPPCPTAGASDHDAARVIAAHAEQGWVLLCNGIIRFDDEGELLTSELNTTDPTVLETVAEPTR